MSTVTGFPDALGTILGIANTIGSIVNKFDDKSDKSSSVEVVEKPVIVHQPSAPIPISSQPSQPININLTINIYSEDGKLLISSKKNDER